VIEQLKPLYFSLDVYFAEYTDLRPYPNISQHINKTRILQDIKGTALLYIFFIITIGFLCIISSSYSVPTKKVYPIVRFNPTLALPYKTFIHPKKRHAWILLVHLK